MKNYEFFEEKYTADIGFTARGDTPEEMLTAACEATMQVMVEKLDDIAPTISRDLKAEASSLDMALFDLLGELIYYKDPERLLMRVGQVTLTRENGRFIATCKARGETIDPEKHQLLVDVKAVTMHHFKVEQTPEGWTATVVLDI